MMRRNLKLLLIITLLPGLSACSIGVNNAKTHYQAGNYSTSIARLQLPAYFGSAKAQYALGYMHYYGLGTPKDIDLGRHWLRKSAKHNYPPARQALIQINRQQARQTVFFDTNNASHDSILLDQKQQGYK